MCPFSITFSSLSAMKTCEALSILWTAQLDGDAYWYNLLFDSAPHIISPRKQSHIESKSGEKNHSKKINKVDREKSKKVNWSLREKKLIEYCCHKYILNYKFVGAQSHVVFMCFSIFESEMPAVLKFGRNSKLFLQIVADAHAYR